MRIARVEWEGVPRYVVVEGDEIFAFQGDWLRPARGERLGALSGVRLLAPCEPSKVVGFGRNYAAHIEELGHETPEEPLMFLKPPTAVIGPEDPIRLPPISEEVHHEAELALVIGRRAYRVPPEAAYDYIAGVTCANDVTARDLQERDGQWTRAKGFDTFCPLGPWVETDWEGREYTVIGRVNGEVRQHGSTELMLFHFARLVAAVTEVMTLLPGDVILTGTPAGVGPIRDGDVVEVEIEGVGVLRNPVRAG